MKNIPCILGALLLVSACAAPPAATPDEAQASAACRGVDAPIGSNIVRKADCAPKPTQNAATPGETKKN